MNAIKKTKPKRLLCILLTLFMIVSFLPTTALAAGTGHQISVDLYKVQIDSTKPLGYTTPEKVGTITVICTDATSHSGYNHFVKLSDFHPSKTGVATLDWSGWCFNGYFDLNSVNNTFYSFTSNKVNATANVTGSEPYPCSKNFYYVYKETQPVTTPVTMEIPISKQVFQNGKHAPGAKTFEFEVEPYGNPQADITSLTITGATIATDGPGTYTGTLNIVGEPDVIDNARGLKITEKNDGAAYWGYDELSCIVYRDTGDGMLIQKDSGTTTLETVQTAVFYNTYKDNTMTVEIPFSKTVSQTGSTAPGANTFEFEVKPYGNSNVDMSAFTITGTTIDTDGAANYTGTIKIVGDAKTIDDAKGFTITEKNTGAANWTYDDTVYIAHVAFAWADNIPMNANIMFAKKTGTGPNAITQEVQSIVFTNVYAYSAPVSTDVTIEIPISKTVKLGGNTAPGAKTFEFEVKPYGNSQADISSLTITGATIATDGAGNYTGTLKIVGDPDVIDNARGLKITEKNDGAANWSYDTAIYIVYPDSGNGIIIQKDMGANMNPQPVQSAEFTNTYTKNSGTTTDPTKPGQDTNKDDSSQTTIPKTGDNSNMLVWIALMVASLGGIATTSFVRRKRVRSK